MQAFPRAPAPQRGRATFSQQRQRAAQMRTPPAAAASARQVRLTGARLLVVCRRLFPTHPASESSADIVAEGSCCLPPCNLCYSVSWCAVTVGVFLLVQDPAARAGVCAWQPLRKPSAPASCPVALRRAPQLQLQQPGRSARLSPASFATLGASWAPHWQVQPEIICRMPLSWVQSFCSARAPHSSGMASVVIYLELEGLRHIQS